MLEVKGYPGDVVQYIGDVPPGLNRNCLGKKNLVAIRNSHRSRLFVLITVKCSSQHKTFPSTGKY